MTRSAYSHFVKSYFEKDRLLFSFMLAEEVSANVFFFFDVCSQYNTIITIRDVPFCMHVCIIVRAGASSFDVLRPLRGEALKGMIHIM